MIKEFDKKGIYFIALGGAEEVGFNMFAYIVNQKMIVVDAGYGFLQDDFPGMEMGLADASFLETYKDDIEAMFITHGHEDHFGAIGHVLPMLNCPVYATDFAIGHIHARLKEYHLDSFANIISVSNNPVVKLENFEVEFVPLVHSVPQTSGLIIRTLYGNIFHATDWRFDDGKTEILPTDTKKLKNLAKEGVELFVGDSTNMSSLYEEPTEYEVRQSLLELIPRLENTIVATCFASNIMRLETLILAAQKAGRTAVISGHSLNQNYKIAKECGYLNDCPLAHDIKDAKDIPLDKILFICAGSQGDYRSALSRIVKGEHKDISLGNGDNIIFSSKIIPGNEDKIEQMQEKLRDAGVEVISTEDYVVHASGHATKSQILEMYNLLKPKTVIPVHGDKRNIRKQKRLAQQNGIDNVIVARNGEVVLINEGKCEIVSEVFTRKLGVDRRQLTPLDSQLIKNRKRIAYNCSVFISAMFNSDWSLADLQISSIDILEEDAFNALRDKIIEDIKEDIAKDVVKLDYKEKQISEYLAARIRKQILKATDIKPVVFMHFYKASSLPE
ncbi:MAG: ribonuclease J [Alphaproteobacteria bacterium]|nr:ribonuclease J [Alphaproteobacteria bacterium]